jgi:hypothetical protein
MAAPAGAQYAPQPRPYDYGQGYGQGYAHQNFGQVRALQARVDRLQRRIERLDRRDALRERLARRLRDETRELERRLRVAARNGLNPYEANGIERRVVQLESRVRSALGRRYDRDEDYGYGRRDGYDGQHAYYGDDNRERGRDRDQDGRGRDRDDD